MRIQRGSFVRAQGSALAAAVLLAWSSASAAPPPDAAVPYGPSLPVVATDLEGLPNFAALRANPNYCGLVLIRFDGFRPSSFSIRGVVNVSPTPQVVPLGMDLRFENTHRELPPKR
jgi:hypothetical protein